LFGGVLANDRPIHHAVAIPSGDTITQKYASVRGAIRGRQHYRARIGRLLQVVALSSCSWLAHDNVSQKCASAGAAWEQSSGWPADEHPRRLDPSQRDPSGGHQTRKVSVVDLGRRSVRARHEVDLPSAAARNSKGSFAAGAVAGAVAGSLAGAAVVALHPNSPLISFKLRERDVLSLEVAAHDASNISDSEATNNSRLPLLAPIQQDFTSLLPSITPRIGANNISSDQVDRSTSMAEDLSSADPSTMPEPNNVSAVDLDEQVGTNLSKRLEDGSANIAVSAAEGLRQAARFIMGIRVASETEIDLASNEVAKKALDILHILGKRTQALREGVALALEKDSFEVVHRGRNNRTEGSAEGGIPDASGRGNDDAGGRGEQSVDSEEDVGSE